MAPAPPEAIPPAGPPRRLPSPGLLAISDGRLQPEGAALRSWLEALAAAGVGAVQIREKELDDRSLLVLVRRARRLLPPEVTLLVNGRVDIALAAGADGVHLPSHGLPVAALRRRFPKVVIGLSTHRPDEVERAREEGADYATFGPIWPTPSKAGHGPPPGLEGLRRAAGTGLPVYALGGVAPERLRPVADAGAAGAAGIRMFGSRESAAEAVHQARRWLGGGTRRGDA